MKFLRTTLFVITVISPLVRAGAIGNTDKINVDFPDEARDTIVRNVGDLYELNIVAPSDFGKDKLSVKVKDATWREIMALSLRGSGYTFIEDAGFVKIVLSPKEIEVADLLRSKLEKEMKENEHWRSLIIGMIETGLIPCEPRKIKAVTDFVLVVDNSPDACLDLIKKSQPNEITAEKPALLPAASR